MLPTTVLPYLACVLRWEDAIRVAESSRHPDAGDLKTQYYKYLLETGQEEKAGQVKEVEGDYLGAISLYLRGGLPARAAQVGVGGHVHFPCHTTTNMLRCALLPPPLRWL